MASIEFSKTTNAPKKQNKTENLRRKCYISSHLCETTHSEHRLDLRTINKIIPTAYLLR